jgi:hypothetical protein
MSDTPWAVAVAVAVHLRHHILQRVGLLVRHLLMAAIIRQQEVLVVPVLVVVEQVERLYG